MVGSQASSALPLRERSSWGGGLSFGSPGGRCLRSAAAAVTRPDPVPTAQTAQRGLDPVLQDLGLEAADLAPGSGDRASLVVDGATSEPGAVAALAGERLGARGALLVQLPREIDEPALANWRNRLWPLLHAVAIYRLDTERTRRQTQGGRETLPAAGAAPATIFALRRKSHVMSPASTREKFDQNASGWNGEPGGPGYPHFRWMRRFVGRFAPAREGDRILDFGCGAGWCGIEAARGLRDVELSSFDPSPEMVRITGDNARAEGIERFVGRVGFGEAPPFPAAGEAPFSLVISSGVVSFSPDFETWMSGLARACAPGARLVVGDIDPRSRGMERRRQRKALLPVRELNGVEPKRVRAWLEARGFRYQSGAGYQLSHPIPQVMFVNETKLGGVLSHPLVWLNHAAASLDRATGARATRAFDSWVMSFTAPDKPKP